MADDRPQFRPRPRDQPGRGPSGPSFGQRPPFTPRPAPPPPETVHSLRWRDGDAEIEVGGSAGFVRQVLDELPALLSRLRGEPRPRPASISMPEVPPAELRGLHADSATGVAAPTRVDDRSPAGAAGNGHGAPRRRPDPSPDEALEARVLEVLRGSTRAVSVAAIRKRLGGGTTSQQVRRVLERASGQVVASGDRPASYRLR